MIIEERASTDDDACRRVFRHQREGLISERQTLQPHVAGRHVDAGKQRLAIPSAFPHDVPAGRARFGERDASTVAPGVHEEGVAWLRHRFGGGDASKRSAGGSGAATGTRDDVKGPSTHWHRWNRPRRDGDGPYVGTTVRVGECQPDFVGRVRDHKENAAREHVGAVVVDSNEGQRRPPGRSPADPKLDERRGVVIRIADYMPLDADRRNRGIGLERPRCHAVRLRRDNCRTTSAAQNQKDSHRRGQQTASRNPARSAAIRGYRHSSQGA